MGFGQKPKACQHEQNRCECDVSICHKCLNFFLVLAFSELSLENPFQAIHSVPDRNPARGYAESSETLITADCAHAARGFIQKGGAHETHERNEMGTCFSSFSRRFACLAEEERRSSAALQKIRLSRRSLARRRMLSVQSVVGIHFGARELTIFSKHGSPRTGSHHGISFNSP
jgi:hypothetical protein